MLCRRAWPNQSHPSNSDPLAANANELGTLRSSIDDCADQWITNIPLEEADKVILSYTPSLCIGDSFLNAWNRAGTVDVG